MLASKFKTALLLLALLQASVGARTSRRRGADGLPTRLQSTDASATVMASSHVPSVTWAGMAQEDQYAYTNFFQGKLGGTYLELGAHNGVHLSNTKALHDYYGWRGVLIEANPAEFGYLLSNRPYDVTVHAAVCASQSSVHYISRDVVGGIWEFMQPTFRERWHPDVDPATLPKVPCLPLKDILAAHNRTHFDFFSLDVEGAEMSVLESIDFGAVSFDVVVIEADEHSDSKNNAIRKFMGARGYRFHQHVAHNDWFVRDGFKVAGKQQAG